MEKLGNIIGFGIAGLIAAGFIGCAIGGIIGGREAAIHYGALSTIAGVVVGGIYGATRKA